MVRRTIVNPDEPAFGEEVVVTWPDGYPIRCKVKEVYGPQVRRMVVVILTPEESNYVVDEPTTFALPLTDITRLPSPA